MNDYSEAANSVAETIAKTTKSLTYVQKTVLAGAMAVWMDKAFNSALNGRYLDGSLIPAKPFLQAD